MLVHAEGFDAKTVDELVRTYPSSTKGTVLIVPRSDQRGYALRIPGSSVTPDFRMSDRNPDTDNQIIVGFNLITYNGYNAAGGNEPLLFSVKELGTGALLAQVNLSFLSASSYTLRISTTSGPQATLSSPLVASESDEYFVQCRFVFDDVNGVLQLSVRDMSNTVVATASATGDVTGDSSSSTPTWNWVSFSGRPPNQAGYVQIDDVFFLDSRVATGGMTPCYQFFTELKIVDVAYPVANSATANNWLPRGATLQYDCVNDLLENKNTDSITYIEHDGTGATEASRTQAFQWSRPSQFADPDDIDGLVLEVAASSPSGVAKNFYIGSFNGSTFDESTVRPYITFNTTGFTISAGGIEWPSSPASHIDEIEFGIRS